MFPARQIARLAPWIRAAYPVITETCATRMTVSVAYRGGLLDFLPSWLGPALMGGGATGIGLGFGMGMGMGSAGPPSGPIALQGFQTGSSQVNGRPHIAPMLLDMPLGK